MSLAVVLICINLHSKAIRSSIQLLSTVLTKMESFSSLVMGHEHRFGGSCLDHQWLQAIRNRVKLGRGGVYQVA